MRAIKPIIAVVVILGFLLSSTFFVVKEGEQAIVTQFGRPIGSPNKEAGLYFKIPLIQKVHYFEKRLLKWDGSPNQIPTRDKKYIWVDTTARWRITNPLRFLQTVATEQGALSRLDDIIDSVVRDLVSSNLLVEIVRSADWQPRPEASLEVKAILEEKEQEEETEAKTLPVTAGRMGITRHMLAAASRLTPRYGIELVDIQIKRINYVESVRQRVFERMISERQRIAAQLRSEGEGRRAEILGQMEKELARIRSEAYRRAQEIRGHGDATAIKIYGQSFGRAPEFYSMVKSLEIYEKYPNPDSTIILSTNSDFFKYLKGTSKGSP